MAKTTKPERKAIAALEDAAAAAKFAKQVSKTLPGKEAKKLRAAADQAKDAIDVSKKAIRKHPKRVAKRADKAADAALAATETALAREQKKAAAEAEAAVATQNAERNAAEKAAASQTTERNAAEKAAASQTTERNATTKAAKKSVKTDAAAKPSPALAEPQTAPDDVAPPEPRGPTDLDTLTVAALRERAKDEGRTGYSRLTKAQLIELLS
ncbi:hypothetical protein G5T42_11235 [Microbacterium sp. 4R-513]|uniref:hypothetical protein n=1 Tax=Microbacterium sp. 4R-513 TaxID=2567934 RepID=UPI0013E1921E|nr:hypothetical protein [Microbacterium sp. 4R-513]QIG39985.1 hypothetical protein G5T42_11235 [Microbacterium sp. 4R-513]